jgi:hypothetical protein
MLTLVCQSLALGCQPRGGAQHADEVALLYTQLADERIDLLVACIGGAGTVEDVCDGQSRLLDALLLAAEHAVRGQRAVVRGDPQRELAAPIGQRALRALKRGGQIELLDIGDPLQVLLDGVKRVAEVKLAGAGCVGVDEIAQVQPGVGSGELQRGEELAVGRSTAVLDVVGVCCATRNARPRPGLASVIRIAHRTEDSHATVSVSSSRLGWRCLAGGALRICPSKTSSSRNARISLSCAR